MNAEQIKREIEQDRLEAIAATFLKMSHAESERELMLLLDGVTIMFFIDTEEWLN
jgi:hypothetical protein